MLACQHGVKTTTAELFSASWPVHPARPVILPRCVRGAVAHEKENSGRRYRRHTCKTPDVVARAARISFRAADGAGTISRKIQRECARLEIRPDINWFSGARAQGPNRRKSKTLGEGVDRFQF